MGSRLLTLMSSVVVTLAVIAVASVSVAGQGAAGSAETSTATKSWTPPRTPWGDPDLQGTWNNGTITPLERPKQYSGRERLSDEEVAALNGDAATRADRREQKGTDADVNQAYNAFWWDRGKSLGRTSLIVDPPDGRIPAYTPEGQKRVAAAANFGGRGADSWLDRNLQERCVVYRPIPPIPTGYNNNYVIVQSPGYVAILQEEIHETRIIPLERRPHISPTIRQWLGDSRGHWEDNTLVVETTNFTDKTNFRGSRGNLRVVERFTRVDSGTLDYQFTVDDPTTWTRPWTAALPWQKSDGELYEYACHEGNEGMTGILSGARAEEKVAEEAAKKGSSR